MLTLTADPNTRPLTDQHRESARAALRAAGATGCITTWLAPGHALDLAFTALSEPEAKRAVRQALPGVPADLNTQPAKGRRKHLLIADMDSTIITSESLDDLAEFIGIHDQVAPITARAMRGEIDFETALRDRVRLLAGQPKALLARLIDEGLSLTGGAKALVRTMRANGAYTALVSGGFTDVTGAVATRVGFDTHRGNVLRIEGATLTGEVGEPILGQQAKLESLLAFSQRRGLEAEQAMAVGDGANDIPMLLRAGTGVAFRAKPAVAAEARFRIEHGDLSALLYLQGYREAQIQR